MNAGHHCGLVAGHWPTVCEELDLGLSFTYTFKKPFEASLMYTVRYLFLSNGNK